MNTTARITKAKLEKAFLLISLFLIPLTGTAQPLSGTYTIDKTGGPFPNFTSFKAAADSLRSQGVDSAVVINVAAGDYEQQFYFYAIPGASELNTITFQGNETDSTKARLYFHDQTASGRYYVICFVGGVSHVTFRKMTFEASGTGYARILNYYNPDLVIAKNLVIENCLFKGINTNDNSTNRAIVYMQNDVTSGYVFRNNYFSNGSYGIYMSGNDTYTNNNFTISGNHFIDQCEAGIKIEYCPEAIVDNNSFYLSNEGAYGIYMNHCDKDISVRGNSIIKTIGGNPGILVAVCNGNGVVDRGIIANNFVNIDGTTVGYGISLTNCEYQGVYHNSVNITNTHAQSRAFMASGGNHNVVNNNIFSNTGGGYAYYLENTNTISSSDYNNYFANWNTLAAWGDVDRATLESLQTANGDDVHSVSFHPRFHSPTNLHTNTYWLDSIGSTETGITTDIDGETRSSPPDIGADEFEPTPPLSGTYKIGGESPDYYTIKDAFDDLQIRGVSGPAIFEIRDDYYPEIIGTVHEIPGASAEDSIVFRSESGDPGDVILNYSTDITDRVILMLIGVDHFTLSGISITATGTENGLALYLRGNCRNINIINNQLSSANTADVLLQVTEGIQDDIHIENNYFSGGVYGLYFSGIASEYSTNAYICGNSFEGSQITAIRVGNQVAPHINHNIITNAEHAGFIPLEIINCDGNLDVNSNTIINGPGDYGIQLESCLATFPFKGLLANNMIQVGGSLSASGINLNNSKRQNIYHNSINITSTDSINGRGIYIQDNNEVINIVNNIIANTGGGYAVYVNDTSEIELSDFNGLYTSGTNLASWSGTDYPVLDSLSAVSGMDENSLTVDPLFYSESDLHTDQYAFMQAATPLEKVRFDIDGHPRDTLNPDIGAMEFFCDTPYYDIVVSVACLGDTTTFIDNSTGITKGASYSWDFNGDWSPEIYSSTPNETVTFLYDTAGTYNLIFFVTQIEGCKNWAEVPVEVIALPALEISTDGAYCGNDDGQAVVNVTNGDGPYTYSWSANTTSDVAGNLGLGTYTVAVSDTNGCTSSAEFTISEAIQVTVEELKGSTCGNSDGMAEVTVTGGVEPYRYVWSDGDTLAVDSVMAPGLHFVNVIDANGCYTRGSVFISNDGTGPEISLEDTIHNNCYGDHEGAINISITGGKTPYDILWSNGAKTEDIENLPAGIYDVVVLDIDSCPATASYIILQPPRLNIGSAVENASCEGNDGRAAALVSGGTEPYEYLWSSGGIHPVEENLAAEIYSITITDANGCEMDKSVIVNSVGGPVLGLVSLTGVTCNDPSSGSINVSTSGGTPHYEWLWSPGGQATPKIENLAVGVYEVMVTDETGCTGFNVFEIKEVPPERNDICFVTVDSATQMNMVVWEKWDPDNASHYNIYREGSEKDNYQLIGSVPATELSIFTDSVADPTLRSWRYKLSVVDHCGNESELSDHHKTIHLTMNTGWISNTVNLLWDHYEGFDVQTYKLYREIAAAPAQLVSDLSGNEDSYTDDVSALDHVIYYYVEVRVPDDGCKVTDKKAATLNTLRSNRKGKLKSKADPEGVEKLMDKAGFIIYPNPGSGVFTLNMDLHGSEDVEFQIFDMAGRLILAKKISNVSDKLETRIDLSGYAPGLYQIHIQAGNGLHHGIMVKE